MHLRDPEAEPEKSIAKDDLTMMNITEISRRTPELMEQLKDLWEASVRATHAFLKEADIQEIALCIPTALAAMPRLVAAMDACVPLGFLGTDGSRLEMLFLSPSARGQGVGRQLLAYAVTHLGVREVCVNEQNPQALGFYQHLGFQILRRTELDEQGRPFPLLYLALPDAEER